MRGRVKFFKKEKGYGFIHAEDGQDYFFHYSELQMEGHKDCSEGDFVTFEPVNEEKGVKACKIFVEED